MAVALTTSLVAVPAVAADPVAAPLAVAGPSATPIVPEAATGPDESTVPEATTDSDLAQGLATDYVDALLADRMADAWALLAPESHARFADDAARFAAERRMYLRAADGRLEVGPATQDPTLLARALERLGATPAVDTDRAWVIELDYPTLAWATSPDDLLLVAPDATDTWRLWWVR
jgi:hypothetical protein